MKYKVNLFIFIFLSNMTFLQSEIAVADQGLYVQHSVTHTSGLANTTIEINNEQENHGSQQWNTLIEENIVENNDIFFRQRTSFKLFGQEEFGKQSQTRGDTQVQVNFFQSENNNSAIIR